MVHREETHRSADTRHGGFFQQVREEVWWFVRARCLPALRAVYRSEWGQGGSSSRADGWDGAARWARRFGRALSTAGRGVWGQIVQVGGRGRSCAAWGSASVEGDGGVDPAVSFPGGSRGRGSGRFVFIS